MTKKKYYAVKHGRQPGIYTTWNETKEHVHGFPSAKYKSFPTRQEAEEWLEPPTSNDTGLQAYVDGSYDKKTGRYSYGVVLLQGGIELARLANSDNDTRYSTSFQIAGECFGCLNAMQWGIRHGYTEITIFYDYLGIEKWATGEWRANKPVSQDYIHYYQQFKSRIEVTFVKVKAHSGVEMNELADQLAKKALKQ